jgi:hypothetical protein
MLGRSVYAWFAWLPAIVLWVFLIFMIPFLGPIAVFVLAGVAVTALGKLAWRLGTAMFVFVGLVHRPSRHPEGVDRPASVSPSDFSAPPALTDGRTARAQVATPRRS